MLPIRQRIERRDTGWLFYSSPKNTMDIFGRSGLHIGR